MNWIFISLLAVLHLIASISGIKEYGLSAIVMLVGSIAIIISILLCVTKVSTTNLLIYVGEVLIIASAIYNGAKDGNPHLVHHIIRITCFVIAIIVM